MCVYGKMTFCFCFHVRYSKTLSIHMCVCVYKDVIIDFFFISKLLCFVQMIIMVNIYSIYSVWSPAYFISFHGYVDIHFFREKHAIILSIFFLAVVCHFSFIYFELFFSVLCVFVCVCVCVWVCNPLSISLDEFRINYSS